MQGPSNDAGVGVDPLPPRNSRSASTSQLRSTYATEPQCATSSEKKYNHWPTREMLYVKKYVELEDYVKDFHSGKLAHLSTPEKIERYGSPIVPIFIPLARGETITEYEERFEEWLRNRKGLTLRKLQTHPDPYAERTEWFNFAHENAKGNESYERRTRTMKRGRSTEREEPLAKKSVRASSESASKLSSHSTTKKDTAQSNLTAKIENEKAKKCTMVPPPESAPRTEVIAAYVACGCQRCLLKAIWHMARKVSEVEAKISSIQHKCSCSQLDSSVEETSAQARSIVEDDGQRSPRPPRSQAPLSRPAPVTKLSSKEAAAITKLVLSRPSPAELVALTSKTVVRRDAARVDEDPVEKQLTSEYDDINTQVITNENVLEASAARLASTPVTDLQETTRLQDENVELRGFVQEEVENRNAALALLVVYLWRHDRASLEKKISDSGVSDVVYVQRMGHHKCSLLAKQIVEKREHAAKIKSQLDAAMDGSNEDESKRLEAMAQLGSLLATAESEVKSLRVQRKREFATLIHFDEHLRLLIKTLLDTTAFK